MEIVPVCLSSAQLHQYSSIALIVLDFDYYRETYERMTIVTESTTDNDDQISISRKNPLFRDYLSLLRQMETPERSPQDSALLYQVLYVPRMIQEGNLPSSIQLQERDQDFYVPSASDTGTTKLM